MTRYDTSMSLRVRIAAPILGLCLVACGNSPPGARGAATQVGPLSPSAAAGLPPSEPPDGVVPKLRTGSLEPIVDPTVHALRVVGRHASDGYETLGLVDQGEGSDPSTFHAGGGGTLVAIDFAPGEPTPAAFVGPGFPYPSRDSARDATNAKGFGIVWIRRALPASSAPITGTLFDVADPDHGTPGTVHHFRVVAEKPLPSDPKIRMQWLRALASAVPRHTAWGAFAAARIGEMGPLIDPARVKTRAPWNPRPSEPRTDLARFMETTTGATAIQEALQTDRSLFALVAREPANIPIASLQGPELGSHPWKPMVARVGAPPPEPLASNVPAEFYYVRAADLPALYHLLDEVDAWGTPAATVLDGAYEERALASRYETTLALKRGPLTRLLGSAVVGEVAVVGSDPYVKEGSDVTVLLQVKSRPLLDAALSSVLAELEREHGSVSRSTRTYAGIDVSVSRSPDGAVGQERASLGDLEIVSNSPNAINAVLDACKALRPRLGDEPDFQYMLARDAHVRADVLGYMGDRFVHAVVGAKQKVLEARRQMALGELMTPGFAALLYGWVQGKSPATVDDLFSMSLLAKSEMVHAGGAPIAWHPGTAARSSWGTPATLTPLIDLPVPQAVTISERAGYQWFVRGYEMDWSAYIDPIALRVAFAPGEGRQTMTIDLRELPLIDGTKYREVADFVGDARFTAPALVDGVRSVVGIGPEAWPRRELTNTLRGFSSREIKFDWVGQWASIGLFDRSVLASALLLAGPDDVPQRPDPNESSVTAERGMVSLLATVPVYAQIAVRGAAQAAVALAAIRVVANETIPGMFEWGEVERYREIPIVRIHMKKEIGGLGGEGSGLNLFYAVTAEAITLTLQDWALRRLIDEALDGRGAAPATDAGSPQASFSLASDPGKGLWTALAWMGEQESLRQPRRSGDRAVALLRGAPEIGDDEHAQRALALAYFGAIPMTLDGAPYTLAKDGLRDPARGTSSAPRWPDVPVPGSPLAKVLQSLATFRSEMSFDDEGKDGDKRMRSLHARVVLDLR